MSLQTCALIPSYNNPRTLAAVVRGAAEHLPVIVVDDGSTDQTPSILEELVAELEGLTVLTHSENRGKGKALVTGMDHALSAGFTHAITLDSDGQHLPEDIPTIAAVAAENTGALVLGHRNLEAAGAGPGSRFGRAFSNFWTFVETGHRLPDTQTGFRCYPLRPIAELHLDTGGFAFEVEVMVKASWVGIPIISAPIQVRYFSGADRVSHMKPLTDFVRIGRLNTRLCTLRCCFPMPYLGLRSLRRFHDLHLRERIKQSFVELFIKEPGSPQRIAGSVGLGLFMGISPFWGLQILLTILLSHLLHASKTIAVIASNISFPLMIPPILYASLVLGRLALGNTQTVNDWSSLSVEPADFWAWVLGSFILATIVAVVGALLTFVISASYQRMKKRRTA